ncbi:hypothetical protein WOC76_12605 [Methylocystis sp. IM3]|uniref:hypothetical protein n=1 Tax=unclassified Methylocystis TaxID=2625913 RepID=UPI0030F9ABD8
MAKEQKKEPIITTMRFDPTLKAALEKAAKADQRSLSSLVMKVLSDWAKENGWLK